MARQLGAAVQHAKAASAEAVFWLSRFSED